MYDIFFVSCEFFGTLDPKRKQKYVASTSIIQIIKICDTIFVNFLGAKGWVFRRRSSIKIRCKDRVLRYTKLTRVGKGTT